MKLVNGHATQAVLDFTNHEAEPVNIAVIGGALSTLLPLPAGTHPSAAIVRNLTHARYDLQIPAGEKQTLPYSFTTDLHPQDLRLNIIAVVASQAGAVYQIQAFNETVSVVEAATSFFDPQMYFPIPWSPVLVCITHLYRPASSCTSSFSQASPAHSTLYTRHGSRPYSLNLEEVAKVVSVPSVHLAAPGRQLIQRTRSQSSELMDRL